VAQVAVLGRVAGRTPVPESQSLEKLAATGSTLCLFLSVGQIKKIASQLSGYYGPDCPAAVIYHASWPDQLILKGTLVDITEKVTKANITKTAMIIVGHALQRPLSHASLLYDTYFTHEFRQGIEK
jgi:precorrin-4/cobalt-precorrin-4 C11-methyltransferase